MIPVSSNWDTSAFVSFQLMSCKMEQAVTILFFPNSWSIESMSITKWLSYTTKVQWFWSINNCLKYLIGNIQILCKENFKSVLKDTKIYFIKGKISHVLPVLGFLRGGKVCCLLIVVVCFVWGLRKVIQKCIGQIKK